MQPYASKMIYRSSLKILFASISLLLSSKSLPAQDPDTLINQAQQERGLRNFDSAYRLYQQAGDSYIKRNELNKYLTCRVEMARASQFTSIVSRNAIMEIIDPAIVLIQKNPELRNTRIAAECYQFLARYFWAIVGQYEQAIEQYQIALDICEKVGDEANKEKMASLADLSHVYSNQEKFTEALQCASDALFLSKEIYGDDHVENGPRHYNLGFTYYRKGYYDQAIIEIRKGIQILENGDGPELQIGLGYNNLSAVYVAQLDQEGALSSSKLAEQIFTKYLGPRHEAIATIQWDLGVMYLDLGEYHEALNHLSKAREIFEENFGPSFPQLPQLYHQTGQCYEQTREYAEAQHWHQKALQINLDQYGMHHVRTGESYRNLAQHFILSGKLDQAEGAIERGFSIIATTENQSDLLRAWLYEQKGALLEARKRFSASANAYDSATLAICQTDVQNQKLTSESTFNPLFFADYQHKKSKVKFQEYNQHNSTEALFESLESAKLAHQSIRRLRLSYRSATSKLYLQKRAREHYDLMMNIVHTAWLLTGEKAYLQLAWRISEETKSLLLLEEIKSSNVRYHDIAPELIDTLNMLKQDIAFYQQTLFDRMENGDSSSIRESQNSYFTAANELERYESKIMGDYPQYEQIFKELSPYSIEEIQAKLNDEVALLEYYKTDSAVYCFVATREEIAWEKVRNKKLNPLLKEFLNVSKDLEKILADPKEALIEYTSLSHQLFSSLMGNKILQSLEGSDQLVIVPDLQLAYISFEALNPSDSIHDYLIDDHSITYAYSASLWLQHQTHSRIPFTNFGGFAPSYDISVESVPKMTYALVTRDGNVNLPGAKDEVLKISEKIEGQVWLDHQATESRFKEKAHQYQILHLSMHGLVDEKEPLRSKLLFAADGDENGELNAYEIYNLPLQSNMAVLSACNTASGALQSGEGVLSLSRAFAFAGVPNLVASLWRADDAAASKIMVDFYQGLARGLTKDRALRSAKQTFLASQKTDTYMHPYFWSSYVVIGENVSQFVQPWSGAWWLIACVLAIIFLLAVFVKKVF